jgi:hypothetical protein
MVRWRGQGDRGRTRRFAGALTGALAAACALCAPASAQLLEGYHTQLLSQPVDGRSLSGKSGGPTISHDKRLGTYVAYHSSADNLVPGDVNRHSDVFVVPRAGSWGIDGTPWQPGQTFIASRGMNGEPANGDSWGPSINGGSREAVTCIAFVSRASNLVPNDTNGAADAFVYYLATGAIQRVSVASRGGEANGDSTQVSVDKSCSRVAFTSHATNLVRGVTATPQVYVRLLKGRGAKSTRVASSTRRGRPGDGPSFDPDMTNWGTHVVFASRAGSLGVPGGTSQVMLKSLPTKARPGKRQPLTMASRTASGQPGNGDSADPTSTYDGTTVAYETTASNIAGGGQHVVQTIVSSRSHRVISRGANGGAFDPSMTDAAAWIFYSTHATNLAENDRRPPLATSIHLWFRSTGGSWLKTDPTIQSAASEPETSMHGNYLVFERSGGIYLEYLGDK